MYIYLYVFICTYEPYGQEGVRFNYGLAIISTFSFVSEKYFLKLQLHGSYGQAKLS